MVCMWFQVTVAAMLIITANSFQFHHIPTRSMFGFRIEVKKIVSDLHEVDLTTSTPLQLDSSSQKVRRDLIQLFFIHSFCLVVDFHS